MIALNEPVRKKWLKNMRRVIAQKGAACVRAIKCISPINQETRNKGLVQQLRLLRDAEGYVFVSIKLFGDRIAFEKYIRKDEDPT